VFGAGTGGWSLEGPVIVSGITPGAAEVTAVPCVSERIVRTSSVRCEGIFGPLFDG
jgi:hypothetical protein